MVQPVTFIVAYVVMILVGFFIQCLNTSCTIINLGHSYANRKVV